MGWFGWAILAAACWGIAPILEKAGLRGPVNPLVGVLIRTAGVLAGALFCLPFAARSGDHLSGLPAKTVLFLAAGGLMASIFGQLAFYRSLKTGPVSQVVPIGASYPILAFLLGVLLLGEQVTFGKLVGIVLVVGGVYLLR